MFTKIVLPLSVPALASFAIFQFLWTWNDLLVAKVLLPSAAFVSIAVPLLVVFSMQRYLVRGLLAGSVK